jgi:hypothetical protein
MSTTPLSTGDHAKVATCPCSTVLIVAQPYGSWQPDGGIPIAEDAEDTEDTLAPAAVRLALRRLACPAGATPQPRWGSQTGLLIVALWRLMI